MLLVHRPVWVASTGVSYYFLLFTYIWGGFMWRNFMWPGLKIPLKFVCFNFCQEHYSGTVMCPCWLFWLMIFRTIQGAGRWRPNLHEGYIIITSSQGRVLLPPFHSNPEPEEASQGSVSYFSAGGQHFYCNSLIEGVILQKSWFYLMVTGPTSHLVLAKDFLSSSSLFIKPSSPVEPNSKWQLTLRFQLSLYFRPPGMSFIFYIVFLDDS